MRTYITLHGKPVIVRNRFGGQHRKMVHIWASFDGRPIRSVFDPIADRRYDRWFGQIRKSRKLRHTTQREDTELRASHGALPEGTVMVWDTEFIHAPTQSPFTAPGLTVEHDGNKVTFASFGGSDEDDHDVAPRKVQRAPRSPRRVTRQDWIGAARIMAS